MIDSGLQELLADAATALAARVNDAGVLADEHGPTPTDHYASTFLAVALALRGDHEMARRLVDAWYRGSPRGHVPFNRFALTCLHDVAPNLADESMWAGWREATPLRDDDPSNNWRLLSATCRVVEGEPAERFDSQLARWLTPAGGFVDGPTEPGQLAVPGSRAVHPWRGSTPIAYHAKAAMLTAIVERAQPDVARAERLAAMRAWLNAFTDDGRLAAFGRSTSALFGDACACVAWLDAIARGTDDAERCAENVHAAVRRLASARRDDGLLPITPSDRGWDPYMHRTVYNAYFVGLVSWAQQRWATPTAKAPSQAAPVRDDDAGLIAARGKGGVALVSTRGQPVQSYASDTVDLRYAGPRLVHMRREARPACVQPSVRASVTTLRQCPALAGSTPIFERRGQLFGAVEALDAPFVAIDGTRVLVVSQSVPQRLHHVDPRRLSVGWWRDELDHRIAGGAGRRARALRAVALAGVEVTSVLAVDAALGVWSHAWWVRGASLCAWLNPCGLAWSGDAPQATARCVAAAGSDDVTLQEAVVLDGAAEGAAARCAASLQAVPDDAVWAVDASPPGAAPLGLELDWRAGALHVAVPWAERLVTPA